MFDPEHRIVLHRGTWSFEELEQYGIGKIADYDSW